MKLARALALAVLGLVSCERHRVPILFPPRGVDVEVKVKLGKDALQGTTAAPTETPPPRCTCCTGAACTCRKEDR